MKKAINNENTISGGSEVAQFYEEIGQSALDQVIISEALQSKYIFSINAKTGDLNVTKKENTLLED